MEARRKKIEDLNITRDEINNIGKALQNEEFRKLFAEYCEEVTNPENKKQYQKEVKELEKQRGVDVTFINPEPGFVVKTSIDGERKAFINICKNDVVSKPTSSVTSDKGSQGRNWSLPFSLAPPREDYDKQKNHCTVFDVVFHSETLQLAEKNPEFRKMLINTALDAVEENCQSKLDRTNMKYPKMAYKGIPQAAVIRKKIPNHQTEEVDQEFLAQMPYPTDETTWTKVKKGKNVPEKKTESAKYATPKYSIKYRHGVELSDYTTDATARLNATVPKELVICIDLPLLNSAKDLNLDVMPKSLSLQCEKPKYKLELVLPYGVDENAGNASFDVTTRKLTVEVPVKRSPPSLLDIGREDSGVESDPGGRADEDSDEKSPSYNSDNGSDASDQQDQQDLASLDDESTQINGNAFSNSTEPVEKDVDYLLPNFSLNTYDNMVAIVLHVKNVDSSSLVKGLLPEEQGILISFCSVGGGMFPQHYGFCLSLSDATRVESDSLSVEIWDNNVVVQFGLTSANITLSEVYVGTGPHDLQLKDVGNLSVVEQKLADLQLTTESAASRSPIVIVHAADEDELVLNVQPFSSEEKKTDNALPENSSEIEGSPSMVAEVDPAKENEVRAEKGRRNAVRHLSECSSDDLEGKKIRGILKKRPVRSLSESNADDYIHYQSSSFSDESGPNSAMGSVNCIAEVGSETGCETENEGGEGRQRKKSVRFNDVVAQQTFRPNSSILGQRKKNQRKQRNKKKAQERRVSESENSEPESEHEKARRRACHSEGEISDVEDKSSEKNKFKKDQKIETSTHQAKKILRRANSSESDEETKDESSNKTNVANPAGDAVMKIETSQPLGNHEESSEDERDEKTELKKKKKKRKGKKVTEQGDGRKIVSKEATDFKSGLVLELEM